MDPVSDEVIITSYVFGRLSGALRVDDRWPHRSRRLPELTLSIVCFFKTASSFVPLSSHKRRCLSKVRQVRCDSLEKGFEFR